MCTTTFPCTEEKFINLIKDISDVTELLGQKLNFRKTQYMTNQVDEVGYITIGNIKLYAISLK